MSTLFSTNRLGPRRWQPPLTLAPNEVRQMAAELQESHLPTARAAGAAAGSAAGAGTAQWGGSGPRRSGNLSIFEDLGHIPYKMG